jgi:alpha-amylase/alpha-mannosidase (GH57 family)
MTYLIIHGHFYQPPRENPWTGQIDAELSAAPFHDWNERIHAECYGPNSAVRLNGEKGTADRVVNNYEKISFDFGPTLLSWLEREHTETYARILIADKQSAQDNAGHGNAIAQAYNHAILPLCNERDRRTQVNWGLADFRYRFGREAESMWLPETACNDDVLGLLIDEGLRFVILAPSQAQRVRSRTGIPACPDPAEVSKPDQWQKVGDAIDTSIAYNYFHRDGSARSLNVFFYDPEISRAIAFEQALSSSATLVQTFVRRAGGSSPLVNVATDGESYGHHHKFGDLCLAHALEIEAPAQGLSATNYGAYLDQHPATMEVEISNGSAGEGSSWSCIHGVGRWIRDCGCHTGGGPDWNQAWRLPLREALDYLRDTAASWFAATRGDLFVDPWQARDEAIALVLNQTKSRERFLQEHAPRSLSPEDEQRALLFLEMQRQLLLMYTSCGWFFNDISGLEPIQILKYAGRAIDIMDQLALPSPRRQFLNILAEAKSNLPEMGNGADIYERFVEATNPSSQTSDAKSLRAS